MNFKFLGDLLIAICPARQPGAAEELLDLGKSDLQASLQFEPSDPSPKNVPTIDPPVPRRAVPTKLNNGERHLDHRLVGLTLA